MTCSYDLFPTILEAAGLPLRPDLHADGMSLMPVISGAGGLGRETLYWNYRNELGKGLGSSGAIRTGDMKLIHFFASDKIRLYDLAADIGERNDLANQRPEEAKRLLTMLEAWRNGFGA
jgi:arylsulfatase A-like enzyme